MESEDRKPIFTKKLVLGILAAILLILIIFLLLRNCGKSGEDYKVSHISLSPTSFGLKIGEMMQVSAAVLPSDAQDQRVTWSSSNSSVASVEQNGVVTGIAEGTATITATALDGSGVTGQTYVTVGSNVPTLDQLQLNKTSYNIKVGKTVVVEVTPVPVAANLGELTFNIANTSIATVDAYGVIKGIAEGTTSITVTSSINNVSATSVVKVSKNSTTVVVPPTTIKVVAIDFTSDGCYQMKVGNKYSINAQIKPTNATDQNLVWESSDKNIAIVDGSGVVTAIKTGTVTIKATATSNVYNTYTIKVISSGSEGSCRAITPSQPSSGGGTRTPSTKTDTVTDYGIKTEDNLSFKIEDGKNNNTETKVNITGTIVADNQLTSYSAWINSAECIVEIGGGIENFRYTATANGESIHRDRAIVKMTDPDGVKVCVTTYSMDTSSAASGLDNVLQTDCATVCKFNKKNLVIELDQEKPSCTISDFRLSNNDEYSFTVNGTDIGSGVSSISYKGTEKKVNNEATKSVEFSTKITSSAPARYTATVHDAAGNSGTCSAEYNPANSELTTVDSSAAVVTKLESSIVQSTLFKDDITKIISDTTDDSNATYRVISNLTYESSNTSVVSVDSDGTVKALADEDATVTITIRYVSSKGVVSDTVIVNVKKGVTPQCNFELGEPHQTGISGEWHTGTIGIQCSLPDDSKIKITGIGICFGSENCDPKLSKKNATLASTTLSNVTGEGFLRYKYTTSSGYEGVGQSSYIKVDNTKPSCKIRINGASVEYVIGSEDSGYNKINISDGYSKTYSDTRTLDPINIPYNGKKDKAVTITDMVGLTGGCTKTITDSEAASMTDILLNNKQGKFYIETSGLNDSFWVYNTSTGRVELKHNSPTITFEAKPYPSSVPTTSLLGAIKKLEDASGSGGYTWTNSNSGLITLSSTSGTRVTATVNNTQTAMKGGSATIKATSNVNPSLTAEVTITIPAATIPVTGLSLGYIPSTLTAGKSVDVSIIYSPYNVTEKKATLVSTDGNVLTVSGNTITAKPGVSNKTAQVYAKYGDLESKRVTITVTGEDTSIPTINVTEPQLFELGNYYIFSFVGNDKDSKVKIYYNTTSGTSCTPSNQKSGDSRTLQIGGSIRSNGTYTVCAYAEDEAGNKSETYKKTYYIKGIAEVLKATFNCGGQTSMRSCNSYQQAGCTVTAPSCTKSGYKFNGWATSPVYSIGSMSTSFKITKNGVTYYATFGSTGDYKLTFNCNGTVTTKKCTPVSGKNSCDITPPSCSKAGYTFNGWSTNSSASSGITQSPMAVISNINGTTYYATWSQGTLPTYTATFKPNGGKCLGSTTNITQTCTVASGKTSCYVNAPICEKEGYTFNGWGVTAIGSLIEINSNKTYTALWKLNTATTLSANYMCNGNKISRSCELVGTNKFCTVTPPSCAKSGYTFVGWNKSATATTGISQPGILMSPTLGMSAGTPNYYAIFVAKPTCSISLSGTSPLIATVNAPGGVASYGWGSNGNGTAYNGTYRLAVINSGTYTFTVKDNYGSQGTCSITLSSSTSCPSGTSAISNGKCCPTGYGLVSSRSTTKCLKLYGIGEPNYSSWSLSSITYHETEPACKSRSSVESAGGFEYCTIGTISSWSACSGYGLDAPCYRKNAYKRSIVSRTCPSGTKDYSGYCYYEATMQNKKTTLYVR